MGRPRKLKHPVVLEVALRLALPKKRPEDRMKIFREWRRSYLTATLKREPTDQELEDEIKLFRGLDFNAANLHPFFWEVLKDFVPVFHKENSSKKAHIAAATRWSRKSGKNPLA